MDTSPVKQLLLMVDIINQLIDSPFFVISNPDFLFIGGEIFSLTYKIEILEKFKDSYTYMLWPISKIEKSIKHEFCNLSP